MTHDSRLTTICWDVDTQVDFMMANGKLSVPGAEAIIPKLEKLTDWAHRTGIRIVASADDHDIGHAEITDTPDWKTTFPPHCMRGTPGQLKLAVTGLHNPLLLQPVPLDSALVAASVRIHRARIIVYGVATDFCTRLAIEGLARLCPTAKLVIVTDAIRGIDDTTSRALVGSWRAAGHTLATSAEVIA